MFSCPSYFSWIQRWAEKKNGKWRAITIWQCVIAIVLYFDRATNITSIEPWEKGHHRIASNCPTLVNQSLRSRSMVGSTQHTHTCAKSEPRALNCITKAAVLPQVPSPECLCRGSIWFSWGCRQNPGHQGTLRHPHWCHNPWTCKSNLERQ